jgi:alkaline phosphatase D
VHAVSNPHKYGKEPEMLHDLAPGYGIARFNKTTRAVSLAAWPRWADPAAGDAPYAGWPVTFQQQDNYGRTPTGYLPLLEISGMANSVVQVVEEGSGDLVYTLRLSSSTFLPMVFGDGPYTVNVGEPGTAQWKTYTGLEPAEEESAGRTAVVFP